jgi:UDPglucose 6-dehydrogenase
MKVTIVGSGYVGLVTGTCLADAGNHVVCVDIDPSKVEKLSKGISPIYEPGLEELIKVNLATGRLRFTTKLDEGVAHGQVIFIAVGTPPSADGSADLSGVEAIVRDVAKLMTSSRVIVIKSTVPVGTGRRMSQIMEDLTAHPFSVVSNPEFLREGAAVEDFLRPDRIIIGSDGDQDAVQLMTELYAPFAQTQTIMVLSRDAAEMVKYASNAYLATRISFINEIADICERTDVDINEVRAGMGADSRIGAAFLYPGVGYGGSCFPKDVQALIRVAQGVGSRFDVLASVHARNELQKVALAEMVVQKYGKDLTGRTLAVWGLAFKPNTDDVRDAPAISVIRLLSKAGATLRCYDPKASANAKVELKDCRRVEFTAGPYEAIEKADGLIICTEWNEFRTPDFDRIRSHLKERVIFDGRNLYDPRTMIRQRIEYHSIGRPTAMPSRGHAAPDSKYG